MAHWQAHFRNTRTHGWESLSVVVKKNFPGRRSKYDQPVPLRDLEQAGRGVSPIFLLLISQVTESRERGCDGQHDPEKTTQDSPFPSLLQRERISKYEGNNQRGVGENAVDV